MGSREEAVTEPMYDPLIDLWPRNTAQPADGWQIDFAFLTRVKNLAVFDVSEEEIEAVLLAASEELRLRRATDSPSPNTNTTEGGK